MNHEQEFAASVSDLAETIVTVALGAVAFAIAMSVLTLMYLAIRRNR